MKKEQFIKKVDEIIRQLVIIITWDLDTREKRYYYGITVFTIDCPICDYKVKKECPITCPISQNKGCVTMNFQAKDRNNMNEVHKELRFWNEVKKLEELPEENFTPETLRFLVRYIDKTFER
jgi:hypothetical protein